MFNKLKQIAAAALFAAAIMATTVQAQEIQAMAPEAVASVNGPSVILSLIHISGNVKTLADYIEETGYETAYIGKWHLASDGELEKPPRIDHTVTAVPRELRGGYTGYWRAADVLEFTSHGYDGYVLSLIHISPA